MLGKGRARLGPIGELHHTAAVREREPCGAGKGGPDERGEDGSRSSDSRSCAARNTQEEGIERNQSISRRMRSADQPASTHDSRVALVQLCERDEPVPVGVEAVQDAARLWKMKRLNHSIALLKRGRSPHLAQ